MKYYIIAGEASGDLHGGSLIEALRGKDPEAAVRCWGGDRMQAAGADLVMHYRNLAFMGFAEVLRNLRRILRNLRFCREDILRFQPDVLVLIDYPGFNLRIARWAHKQGIRVVYYISPQVWAWKESRVKQMKKCIDRMIVILPFEKDYYAKRWSWDVTYAGHPLIEVVNAYREKVTNADRIEFSDKPVIALLPGSRRQEVLKKLPVMLAVSRHFPAYRFVVARAPGLDESFYHDMLSPFPGVTAVSGKTYELLARAKAALVTSGTATLETALFGVPQVVCYKSSWLSYQIGKRLVKVKYISLVNLIMDKPVVPELIQQHLTEERVEQELRALLEDPDRRSGMQADYATLWNKLRTSGSAAERAAGVILDRLAK
jgi:lipid-A-disaccharide synthase